MLKRYFWLVYVLLVTLAALLGADITTFYIGAKLATPVASEPMQTGPPPAQKPRTAPGYYEVIRARNIFNARPPQAGPPQPEPLPPPPETEVLPTALRLVLAGTVTGANNQRYAIIADMSNGETQAVYQVGDVIQNALITEIGGDCIVLDKGGQYESLCFDLEGEATKRGRTPRRQLPLPASEDTNDDTDSGIVRVDTGTWRVNRELILDQFGDFGGLTSQARLMPYIVQGQSQGFRVMRLKGGSMLQKIGLQNGDVITKVNGLSITSPAEALQVFQQLHSASIVRLQLLRRNRDTTLTYELR
ncbi:hypothetical protein NKDENANG_01358 [Candidatus Entotheonellaceae bacterium PAL068K]